MDVGSKPAVCSACVFGACCGLGPVSVQHEVKSFRTTLWAPGSFLSEGVKHLTALCKPVAALRCSLHVAQTHTQHSRSHTYIHSDPCACSRIHAHVHTHTLYLTQAIELKLCIAIQHHEFQVWLLITWGATLLELLVAPTPRNVLCPFGWWV